MLELLLAALLGQTPAAPPASAALDYDFYKARVQPLFLEKREGHARCVTCHGDDAKGKPDLGAPDLTDRFWIYGGSFEAIDTSIWGGRQGRMPSWENRLSNLDRKILALYLVDKRSAGR